MPVNLKNAEPGKISAWYDGEDLPENGIVLEKDDRLHMQKWSLIGSVMRGEISVLAPESFADSVMAKLPSAVTDQSQVSQTLNPSRKSFFKGKWRKVAFVFTQTAVAASIAMVTIFGWQTWNAGENFSISDPAANAVMGPVSVNLASYQSAGNDKIINLDPSLENNSALNPEMRRTRTPVNHEIRQQQSREAERINAYLRGYVLNTAAN